MIQKINHTINSNANRIRSVFQVSYAVEAELLGAKDFPPLKRPLEAFINAKTEFYGYFAGEQLAAVMEVYCESDSTHIHSLVVDPKYFRKGIASKLIQFLFENFDSLHFTVETGAANEPAISLYERHGFRLVKKWMTEIGIEKVGFEKSVD